jgi:hypothetical protein
MITKMCAALSCGRKIIKSSLHALAAKLYQAVALACSHPLLSGNLSKFRIPSKIVIFIIDNFVCIYNVIQSSQE